MADNDALKATPAEVKKRTVEALVRERVGYERRLIAAEGEPDEVRRSDMQRDGQRRLDEVNAQLRSLGEKAAAPAKRSESRPATVSARAER